MNSRTCTLFFLTLNWASLALASEFRSDFSDGLGPWQKSPTGVWEAQSESSNDVVALVQAGVQSGGVRRPAGFLLLPQFIWSDYQFSLRAKTLEPATTVRRDVVLIFGYVDSTHFYYVHISSDSDDKFHNVMMKVDGETRQTIHQSPLPEARLTGDWHAIRVAHESNGSIQVYVDNMDTPLMTASDQSFPAGAVGFGCFDDRALFDDVVIRGDARSNNDP
jgi:hypothetical protein